MWAPQWRVREAECGRRNGGFVRTCVGAAMVFVHFCEKIQKNVQSLVHKQGKIRKMYKGYMVLYIFARKAPKMYKVLYINREKCEKMYKEPASKEPASKEPAPKYTIPKESLCVTIYLTSLAGALPPEKMTGTELYSII